MATFPYSNFQVIFGRSDPRTALIFSHPFEAIYPHIVTLGQEIRCQIVRYPPPKQPTATDAFNESNTVSGYSPADRSLSDTGGIMSDRNYGDTHRHHHLRPFNETFDDAFDNGHWLVVDSLTRVEHLSWRHVGARLAVTVPSAKHHLRKHFRLFTFLTAGQDVHMHLPPIMLQFAMVIDTAGAVHAKSTVGPLFETDTMIDDINQVLSSRHLTGGSDTQGDKADGRGGTGANKDSTNRNQPYTTVTKAKSLARGEGTSENSYDDTDQRSGAMTDLYIEDVICVLKDELLQDQLELIADVDTAINVRVSELDRRLAARMGVMGSVAEADEGGAPIFGETHDGERARTQIFEEETKKANDDYGWIYPAIHEWVVLQHPSLNLKAVQTISDAEISKDRLIWQTSSETCYNGIWCGSGVLIKGPVLGYSTDKNFAYQQASRIEAALHSTQRHPHILVVYGVLQSDKCTMIMEEAVGTVEQTFMRCRERLTYWKLGDYLRLAQHVLRGLQYLAPRVTHRDIAARSVVEVVGGNYKISQFMCASPIKAQTSEGKALVPIRWSSPEALAGMFSHKSDMWSFGVLMWECLHYCTELPYSKEPQAASAISNDGVTLVCRTEAARLLFDLLCAPCFESFPEHRPTAAELLAKVDSTMFLLEKHILDRRIPMPGDVDQTSPYPSATPP